MHLHALDSNLKSCCEVKKNTDRSDSETSSRKRITNWQCLELKATESYNQRGLHFSHLSALALCRCSRCHRIMVKARASKLHHIQCWIETTKSPKTVSGSPDSNQVCLFHSKAFQGIELCFVGYTRNIKKHVCLNDKLINASSLRRAWKCATSTEPDSLLRKHWRDFVRMEADCESAGQNKHHQPHHIFLPIKLGKCNIHPVLPGSFVWNKGETERKKSGWILPMDKSMRSISILSAK